MTDERTAEIAARLDELAQEWLQGQHTPEWYVGDATVADWRDAYRAVAYDLTMKLGARNTEAELILLAEITRLEAEVEYIPPSQRKLVIAATPTATAREGGEG